MKKILLIEDDSVLRNNTAELLELSNYQVLTASNGITGIEKAKYKSPDIIVCDIMMPEIDGYSVLDILSRNNKTKYIPFIFLSAKSEKQDVRKGMNLGADDYITKPFNEEELISAIESRLAKVAILEDIRNKEVLSDNDQKNKEIHTAQDLKTHFSFNGEVFNFNTNETIYKEGNNSNYIYFMESGVVKSYKLDEQGKELTTALYKKGDLFGYTSFTDNIPYQETATAIKDTKIIGLTKKEFKNILNEEPNVMLEFIHYLTDDLKEIKDQLLETAYSSVIKKTASSILKFAEKMNAKPGDPIKISRSDLASVAGIATETFIRTMSDFKRQGIIQREGRNIKIVDVEKLKQIY